MLGWPDETNTGLAAAGLTADDLSPLIGEYGAFAGSTWNRRTFNTDLYSGTERTRIDSGDFVASECFFYGPLDSGNPGSTVTLTMCDVDGRDTVLGVGYRDLTLIRCHMWGGIQVVNTGPGDVYMEDCYVHDPYLPPGTDAHINPFFCGEVGAGKSMHFKHCKFWAPIWTNEAGGGVSTNLSFFPDFGPINNVTVEDCFIGWTGGSYGVTLGWNPGKPFNSHPLNATNITFKNNVFEIGPTGQNGLYGPVTSWRRHETNVWENNRYEDGTLIPEPA